MRRDNKQESERKPGVTRENLCWMQVTALLDKGSLSLCSNGAEAYRVKNDNEMFSNNDNGMNPKKTNHVNNGQRRASGRPDG